jgi:excisionase family DNA binding protein
MTDLLLRKEVAAMLKLQPQTLAAWAVTGKHLPFVKLGRSVRYRRADVVAFVERQTIGGDSAGSGV